MAPIILQWILCCLLVHFEVTEVSGARGRRQMIKARLFTNILYIYIKQLMMPTLPLLQTCLSPADLASAASVLTIHHGAGQGRGAVVRGVETILGWGGLGLTAR